MEAKVLKTKFDKELERKKHEEEKSEQLHTGSHYDKLAHDAVFEDSANSIDVDAGG